MSWMKFFSMGGYAFYVWGSYLISVLVIGGEIFLLWRRRKLLQQAGLTISEADQNEKTA
jgi:heme exporter protein D